MIWPRKNPSSSSSSSGVSSLSEALFPISWLSKFKQMSRKSNSPPTKTKRKTKPSSPINPCLPATAQHDIAGKNIQSVSNSILYDTHDELDVQFPFSSCQSCRELNTREDDHMFSDMVSNIRKMRVEANDDDQEWKQEHLLLTPRRRIQKGRHRKVVDRGLEELYSEKNMSDLQAIPTMEGELEARKSAYISSYPSIIAQHGEKCLKREDSSKQVSKSEKQRKSVYVSRGKHNRRVKQSCKVKAYSPKTAAKVEFCKIKALEDLKKAKMKKKAISTTQGQPLESFAVVKSSFDPCKDFRDSMVEMIEENCIWEPEELEDLLACYLSLNSNEYHDLIVKVFQQVWFEMNKDCSSHELPDNDNCI